jgi:hypothetical protein
MQILLYQFLGLIMELEKNATHQEWAIFHVGGPQILRNSSYKAGAKYSFIHNEIFFWALWMMAFLQARDTNPPLKPPTL